MAKAKHTSTVSELETEMTEETIKPSKETHGIYPTWRYHKTEPAVIVNSYEEDQALGKGWSDAPTEV